GGADRHVHDVRAQPLAGKLEGGLRTRRGLVEQVDLRAAAQCRGLLLRLPRDRDRGIRAGQQKLDVGGRKSRNGQQTAGGGRWGKGWQDPATVVSSGGDGGDADTRQAGQRTCLAFSPAFGWDSAALYMLSGRGQNCRFSDGESRLTQEVLNQPPPLTGTNAW